MKERSPDSDQSVLADTWLDEGLPLFASRALSAPVLSAGGVEGPLDWILDRVLAQRIDLAELPIATLIEAFDDALTAALEQGAGDITADLSRWGDWLVMAAQLTLLHSRLLLPADAAAAKQATDEAEALRSQLLDRAAIRAAADWLQARPQLGQEVFTAAWHSAALGRRQLAGRQPLIGDIAELLRACLVALRLPEMLDIYQPAPPPLLTVAQATIHLRAALPDLSEATPLTRLMPAIAPGPALEQRRRAVVSSMFVAGLELARSETLTLTQEQPWEAVMIGTSSSG